MMAAAAAFVALKLSWVFGLAWLAHDGLVFFAVYIIVFVLADRAIIAYGRRRR